MNDRLSTDPESLIIKYGTRDPFRIACLMGHSVKFLKLKRQKGYCTNILNNYFIFINENLSLQMQRMVCAHELGHVILHKDRLRRDESGKIQRIIEMELFDIKDRTEYEANLFAAGLLIDTDEMMGYLREGYDIVQTASSLDVNVNLLALKLSRMMDADLPFPVNSQFLGKIEDRAGSI